MSAKAVTYDSSQRAGSVPQLTSDVVIIGGGIAGLSLAAAIEGRCSVVLVEAEDTFAFHTSSRSAQQMQPTYGPAEVRALTRASIPLVREIEQAIGARILSSRPLLWCGFGDTTIVLDDLIAHNPGVTGLTTAEALAMLPVLRSDLLAFAGIDNNAYQVDVSELLRWYRAEAERTGATLLTGSPVTSATRSGGSWTVTAGGQQISAPLWSMPLEPGRTPPPPSSASQSRVCTPTGEPW
jgi:D-arginine dehydrogenase